MLFSIVHDAVPHPPTEHLDFGQSLTSLLASTSMSESMVKQFVILPCCQYPPYVIANKSTAVVVLFNFIIFYFRDIDNI